MSGNAVELIGRNAIEFASKLRLVSTDSQNWVTHYMDDSTGKRWVMDYPDAELQGGGSPRLRQA